jgi:hypothetical protein
MKTLILGTFALALLSSAAFADTQSEMARVRQLADHRIAGTDVRKTVTRFNNTEGNPCAPEGISYVVNVQVRKTEIQPGPNGEPGAVRKWEDFAQYSISRQDLLAGKDIDDSICLE